MERDDMLAIREAVAVARSEGYAAGQADLIDKVTQASVEGHTLGYRHGCSAGQVDMRERIAKACDADATVYSMQDGAQARACMILAGRIADRIRRIRALPIEEMKTT